MREREPQESAETSQSQPLATPWLASALADFRVLRLYFLGGTADTGGMETNASPTIIIRRPSTASIESVREDAAREGRLTGWRIDAGTLPEKLAIAQQVRRLESSPGYRDAIKVSRRRGYWLASLEVRS